MAEPGTLKRLCFREATGTIRLRGNFANFAETARQIKEMFGIDVELPDYMDTEPLCVREILALPLSELQLSKATHTRIPSQFTTIGCVYRNLAEVANSENMTPEACEELFDHFRSCGLIVPNP